MHGGDHPVDRGLRPFDIADPAGEAQRGSSTVQSR